MNRKRLIILALFVIAILWWYSNRKPNVPTPTYDANHPDMIAEDSKPSDNRTDANTHAAPMTAAEFTARQEENFRKLTNAINEGKNEWRTPIEFFGKIVDENTNVVLKESQNIQLMFAYLYKYLQLVYQIVQF